MKQLLKSTKRFKLILAFIIVLVVAIIVTAVFAMRSSKRDVMSEKLKALQESATLNEENMNRQYGYYGDDDLSGTSDTYQTRMKSFKEIKTILDEYPSDYEEAIKITDIYSVGFGFPLFGIDKWDQFVADSRTGRPGNIVMVQFSGDYSCVYYYIEYDGEKYHVIEDRSRDSEDPDSGYAEAYGQYLHIEQYPAESGYAEYAYLTDDPTMTFRKAESFYSGADESITEEPSYWQIYIGVVTAEMIANNQVDNDGSEENTTLYTGFTDNNPYYSLENPMSDYDGDGILDRVYRECSVDEEGNVHVSAYLLLGNGKTVILSSNIWGSHFATDLIDFTSDGNKDICFKQYSDDECEISIFKYIDGDYIKMNIPLSKFDSVELFQDRNNINSISCVGSIDDTGVNKSFVMYYCDDTWKLKNVKDIE